MKKSRILAEVSETARGLNRTSTVQKWEIGAKRPSGPSLKLLNVIHTKGVDVLS